MNNDLPSKNKWETHAAMKRAEIDVARAQQQNITIEQLAAQDERERLARLPEPVESENQEAITKSVEHTESSHSLFGFESGESSAGETTKQETSTQLFGQSQELDSSGEEL